MPLPSQSRSPLAARASSPSGGSRPSVAARLALAAVGALMLLPLACGPSFQAVYEGDARFEKCYALDESPQAPLTQKTECWNDWSRRYTYGQTRDRIDYARTRYAALSRVSDVPTDEAIMQAAPGGGGGGANVSAPMPTSAFAPPPGTLVQDAGAPGASSFKLPTVAAASASVVAAPAEPESSCSTGCSEAWRSCGDRCKGAACDACARDYRKCMRACFKDDGAKKMTPSSTP